MDKILFNPKLEIWEVLFGIFDDPEIDFYPVIYDESVKIDILAIKIKFYFFQGKNFDLIFYRNLNIKKIILISEATSFDFNLIGSRKTILFKFKSIKEFFDEFEIRIYRPISTIGWVFWIFCFFLIGIVMNLSKLKDKSIGFNLRNLLI